MNGKSTVAAFWLLLAAAPVRADIIDRIAVSVSDQVITASDIDREIRVTTFLNGTKPDWSPATKRATAERMVEQLLIRRELETSRYPMSQSSEIDPVLDKFKHITFPTPGDYERALSTYRISEDDVKASLLWQRTLLQFVALRFRPGVQVSDQEIQDYFDKVVAPAARAAHPGEPVSIDDYRDQIRDTLSGQRADQEMDNWLREARKRTEINFHEEALK